MNTYANLEVSPDGEILQSSITVPSDGVLPKPMSSSLHNKNQKAYTERIAPTTIKAAVQGPDESLRVTAIYAPTHAVGLRLTYLLAPALIALAVLGVVYGNLLVTNALTDTQRMTISLALTVVIYLTVLYPCTMWARHIYYRGGPTPRTLRKISARYPEIPIFRDHDEFLLATQTDT